MILTIFYFISVFSILIFIISVAIYLLGLIYSSFKGSPYVPTKRKIIQNILKESGLKKGFKFIDIGCGDGRVVEEAVSTFGAKGVGIDINLLLILRAQIRAKLKNLKNIKYITGDIKKIDLSNYNMIYVFLMPKFIEEISLQLEKALMKKTIVVSHGFKVNRMEKYLKKIVTDKSFPTYVYNK